MDASNYYTMPQVREALQKGNYKVVEIIGVGGEKPITGSGVGMKPEKWYEERLLPFSKRKDKAGIYYINCYQDSRKKTSADVLPLMVGSPSQEQLERGKPLTIHLQQNGTLPAPVPGEKPPTWSDVLGYIKQISDLEAKVADLERQLETAKAESAKLSESNNELKSKGDNKEIIEMIMPAIESIGEQFMADRKEGRMLEMMRLAQSDERFFDIIDRMYPPEQPTTQKQRGPSQNDVANAEREAIKKFNDFVENKDLCTDEENTILEGIRDKSGNFTVFMQNIASEQPELYNRIRAYIKGGAV